jgi:hypothetical protein
MEVHHAVAETAFVQQLELHADVIGEGPRASPATMGREEENSTVIVLRCSRESAAAACSVPHSGQNLNGRSDSKPHVEQAGTRQV